MQICIINVCSIGCLLSLMSRFNCYLKQFYGFLFQNSIMESLLLFDYLHYSLESLAKTNIFIKFNYFVSAPWKSPMKWCLLCFVNASEIIDNGGKRMAVVVMHRDPFCKYQSRWTCFFSTLSKQHAVLLCHTVCYNSLYGCAIFFSNTR